MPLQRYRDLEQAREDLWVRRRDPRLFTRIRELWTFAERLAPGHAPRGVRRFRTLEEAQRDRNEWVARRALLLRKQRAGS
jgi:hypothetical protein